MKITSNRLSDYLSTIEATRRRDVEQLIILFMNVTGYPAIMWGDIIGFGHVRYSYPSGHKGEMPLLSFSSRKEAMTLYLGFDADAVLKNYRLGKYRIGKGCLYINKLSDIDISILQEVITTAKEALLALEFIQLL